MSEWKTTAPPNETIVEVEYEAGKIIRALAFYGREGYRPHWRSEDGKTHWPASAFKRWRSSRSK